MTSLLGFVLWQRSRSGTEQLRPVGVARSALVAVLVGPMVLGPTLLVGGCASSGGESQAERRARDTLTHAGGAAIYLHSAFAPGPALITGEAGEVVSERRFEPFGAPLEESRDGTVMDGIDFSVDPFSSVNQPTDVVTGLTFHGARWLSPMSGRWLTPDPPVKAPNVRWSAQPESLNPYQYVNNNPMTFWDPDGRDKLAWREVEKGSAEFDEYFVGYNIKEIIATPDDEGNVSTIVVHYDDGRTLEIGLWRIAETYRQPTYAEHRAQMREYEEALAGHRGLGEDIRIVGVASIGSTKEREAAYQERIKYIRVGQVVLPYDTETDSVVFNKRETPTLVRARLIVDLHVYARQTNLKFAEIVNTFSGIMGFYGSYDGNRGDILKLQNTWYPSRSPKPVD